MASPIVVPGGEVPSESNVYRALNPKHLENGLPGDMHFVMKATHARDDGVSTGVDSAISLHQFQRLDAVSQMYGFPYGVAKLNVGELIAPVSTLGIRVLQQDAPEWGEWAGAHAIITGYPTLIGNQGKRQIRDFQRHLVKLARKIYYPAGSDIPPSTD